MSLHHDFCFSGEDAAFPSQYGDRLRKRNPRPMTKLYIRVLPLFAFVPFLTIPTTLVATSLSLATPTPLMVSIGGTSDTVDLADEARQAKADAIDQYFKERDMPLAGYGMTFTLVAEKYGLDWSLLPAIAVRESSGGRAKCGYNPFGWGSCKASNFSSYEQAIDIVGRNLGGANPKTARYYANTTSKAKLYYYNGTVEPTYPGEVLAIMRKIESYNK